MVAIIGEAARANEAFDWFGKLPLLGRKILVTRPAHQATSMIGRLSELGAHAILAPSIAIEPPESWHKVDDAIQRIAEFDFLVFSSSNGVHYFLRRLLDAGLDTRALAQAKLAAIGPRTGEALREYSLHTDVQPSSYRAEALADALASDAAGKRFLLLRASRGREVLAERIQAQGGTVEQVVVYNSVDVATPSADVEEQWNTVDWVTVTSSAIARSLHRLWGERLRQVKLASISPITSQTLRECGLEPAAEANVYTSGRRDRRNSGE